MRCKSIKKVDEKKNLKILGVEKVHGSVEQKQPVKNQCRSDCHVYYDICIEFNKSSQEESVCLKNMLACRLKRAKS